MQPPARTVGCARTVPVQPPPPASPKRASGQKRSSASAKAAAAAARPPRGSRVVTALDAPASVRRVLEDFDPAALVWADPDHRYVIVRESLIRGDRRAVRWLRSVLP